MHIIKLWHKESDLAPTLIEIGLPCGSPGKESTCNVGDLGSTPELGRSHGEGNGYPLQYTCLENSKDRGAWRDTVHGIVESVMTEQLSTQYFIVYIYHTRDNFLNLKNLSA